MMFYQFILDSINFNILNLEGSCPAGTDLGEWSDGEGECCCDPEDLDLILDDITTTEVSSSSGLVPHNLTQTTTTAATPMCGVTARYPLRTARNRRTTRAKQRSHTLATRATIHDCNRLVGILEK